MNIAGMEDWFYNEEAGKYWLKECIGRGGSGSVFRAYEILQKSPDRPPSVGAEVAVKVMQPDPTDSTFFQTLQLAASLEHPHILRCKPPGALNKYGCEFYYLPMEMAGESLHAVLQRGPLTLEQTLELARSLASALDYTHTLPQRVIHRDLKPGNILRVGGVWKLCDFGIARVLTGPGGHLTKTTTGTEGYLPPERVLPQEETLVDTAYDIWPLGIVLLEALGQLAPGSGLAIAMRAAVLKQDPDLPDDLPEPLGEIIQGCLRFDWTQRISANEALATLRPVPSSQQPSVQPIAMTPSMPEVPSDLVSPTLLTMPPIWSPHEIVLDLGNGISMQLNRIPPGNFLMGDDLSNNKRRTVFLREYYMQTTPVTVAQYREFCKAKKSGQMPEEPVSGRVNFNFGWSKQDHPIVNVSFHDAQAFCAWVTETTGKQVALPTEEEWEKAARGTDGKKYPWGNEELTKENAGRLLWSSVDSGKSGTSAVGQFSPNEDGFYDMSGNVWEWCNSDYDGTGNFRAVRGSSWNYANPDYFRCACRDWDYPDFRSVDVGFRVVVRSD